MYARYGFGDSRLCGQWGVSCVLASLRFANQEHSDLLTSLDRVSNASSNMIKLVDSRCMKTFHELLTKVFGSMSRSESPLLPSLMAKCCCVTTYRLVHYGDDDELCISM